MPVFLLAALLITVLAQETSREPAPPPDPLRPFVFSAPTRSPSAVLMNPPWELTKKELLRLIFNEHVRSQFLIHDYENLEYLWLKREVVEIVDEPELTCVKLRKSGRWPLAEKEPDALRKVRYYGLRKQAAGLLYQIADRMRKPNSICAPFEVTSMVRTWDYQLLLMDTNPTANVFAQGVPPTHAFGLAFDITRVGMPHATAQQMLRYLVDLASQGKVVYFLENSPQAAFHVIALPSAETEFTAYFEKKTEQFTAVFNASAQGGSK